MAQALHQLSLLIAGCANQVQSLQCVHERIREVQQALKANKTSQPAMRVLLSRPAFFARQYDWHSPAKADDGNEAQSEDDRKQKLTGVGSASPSDIWTEKLGKGMVSRWDHVLEAICDRHEDDSISDFLLRLPSSGFNGLYDVLDRILLTTKVSLEMGIVIKMVIAQLLGTDDERQYRAAILGLALGWQAEPLSSAVKQLIGKTTMAPVWDELHTVLGPVMDALTAPVATGVATVRGEEEDDELRQDYYCSAPGRPSSSPYNSWLLPVLVTTLKEKNILPDHLQTALNYLLTSPGLILLPSAKPSVLSSWRQMALTLKENVVDTLLEASKSADVLRADIFSRLPANSNWMSIPGMLDHMNLVILIRFLQRKHNAGNKHISPRLYVRLVLYQRAPECALFIRHTATKFDVPSPSQASDEAARMLILKTVQELSEIVFIPSTSPNCRRFLEKLAAQPSSAPASHTTTTAVSLLSKRAGSSGQQRGIVLPGGLAYIAEHVSPQVANYGPLQQFVALLAGPRFHILSSMKWPAFIIDDARDGKMILRTPRNVLEDALSCFDTWPPASTAAATSNLVAKTVTANPRAAESKADVSTSTSSSASTMTAKKDRALTATTTSTKGQEKMPGVKPMEKGGRFSLLKAKPAEMAASKLESKISKKKSAETKGTLKFPVQWADPMATGEASDSSTEPAPTTALVSAAPKIACDPEQVVVILRKRLLLKAGPMDAVAGGKGSNGKGLVLQPGDFIIQGTDDRVNQALKLLPPLLRHLPWSHVQTYGGEPVDYSSAASRHPPSTAISSTNSLLLLGERLPLSTSSTTLASNSSTTRSTTIISNAGKAPTAHLADLLPVFLQYLAVNCIRVVQ